jgi:hypothetical protein
MLEGNQQLLESTMADFTTLNRVTLGQLQSSMMAAGLKIKRVAATADTIDVPEDLLRYPLSDLVLSEIKILAVKD